MKQILIHAYRRAKGEQVKEHTRTIGNFSGLTPNEAAQVAVKMFNTGLAPGSAVKETKITAVQTENFKAHPSHLSAELLAKAAYETSEVGTLPAGYRVAEKFSDPKTGMAVSVFISPNKKAVIAFRGTEGSNVDVRDILTDLDPRGVGFGQFQNNKQALATLSQKYPGAMVTGHSLGGALAQRYAAEFGAGEVVTFNSPGIDKNTAAKFKKGKSKVTHYVSHGDPVSLGGEKFIDGEAKIISYKSGKIPIVGNTLDKHMAAVTGGLMGVQGASVKTVTASELSNPNFKYGGTQVTSFTDRRAIENRRKAAGLITAPLNPIVGFAGQALGMIGIGNK